MRYFDGGFDFTSNTTCRMAQISKLTVWFPKHYYKFINRKASYIYIFYTAIDYIK